MFIIPVLDIRCGLVVHAKGGVSRAAYAPLNSAWCPDASPYTLLDNLCPWLGGSPVYLADLDALQGRPPQQTLIQDLIERYAGVGFWIDSGMRRADAWPGLGLPPPNLPVIASETFDDPSGLEAWATSQDWVASLDTRDGLWSGARVLSEASALWPKRIILMSLDRIGGPRGPDLERLRGYRAQWPNHDYFLAGGVRNRDDLSLAAEAGAAGVLIASWLHGSPLRRPPWT